jgi:hypothetical protein
MRQAETTASLYSPYWIGLNGQVYRLGRDIHMQYVRRHPERFGLGAEQKRQLESVPDHFSDLTQFPDDLIDSLLDRWVRVQTMQQPKTVVLFTVGKRPGRKHLAAIQDFLMDQKLLKARVLVQSHPTGKMLLRGRTDDILKADSLTRRAVAWKDQLPGGLADRMSPDDFDPAAVLEGLGVELEHTDDRRVATEIALDHLAEDPDYYRKLATIHEEDDLTITTVMTPDVQQAKPRPRVFIEGDEFYAEVGAVANELFGRGSRRLGDATLDWLKAADVPAARGSR